MRVLLQNFETGQFYTGPDGWTADALLAYDFESIQHAVETYKAEHIEFASIVLDDGPSLGRVPLRLADERKAANTFS